MPTPGHTRDSISVLLSDGSAFVGDAAMNFLRWTGVRHRPIYIEDINTVYESWRKLRERGAKVIYPSHGRPFSATELTARQWASQYAYAPDPLSFAQVIRRRRVKREL